MDKENKITRRNFIRKAGICTGGIFLGSLLSCGDKSSNPLFPYEITQELCIGCAECQRICPHDSIILDKPTQYTIEADCYGCGDCVEVCPYEAIDLPDISEYKIRQGQCLGCGDCQDACEYDAIELEQKSTYETNNDCVGCLECKIACPHGAITSDVEQYSIDYDKCTQCGLCISVNEGGVCTYDAMHMEQNDQGEWLPVIDQSKCEKCGD